MIDHDRIRFLADIPTAHAAVRGADIAVAFEDRTLSYAELERRSRGVANALIQMGVKPGDRISWLGKNCDTFFEVCFGAARARACLAPINFRLAVPEIAFILQDAGSQVFFVTEDFFDVAEAVVRDMERPPRLIAIGGDRAGFESFEPLRDGAPAVDLPTPEASDDVLQLYTSGTTGLPKGVRLSNANYEGFMKISPTVEGFSYEAHETVLIVMPLFHVAGTNISFAGLASGSRVIILADFSPARVLQLMGDEKVSHCFLAPAMIQMLLQAPEIQTADLTSMRTVCYGASPIGEAVLAQAKARFGCGFVQFYGMTETCGSGSFLAPSAHEGELLRSCGRPWPEVEMRIQDLEGREVPVGGIGEIAIKGWPIMAGYWNRPEATAETISEDGWLRTGDAGYRNAEGYYFVHDRVKDMIVSGGENVYPAEVENAIFGCPGVADAAVIGVPDEKWGESVKAIIVPAAGSAPKAEDVIAWARQRIAGYKAPKTVEFVDALPRNASGKVLRRELRKPYWEGRDRQVG